ncbi:MAG: decaprenyl-phosphate phosphoribosyltransferase [Clostridiaceae bacterium]
MNLKALFLLIRPKQWIKNFFVFAAIIFSGNFTDPELLFTNLVTFALFCLTSSSVYIINDIVDIEKDRAHPTKKFRPLPSGIISISAAMAWCAFMIIIVAIASYMYLDYRVAAIFLIYFLLNIAYSFKLKNVVIMDAMCITLGFVLRVSSGSYATGVKISPWLFLCTILLSLFIAFNKRKSEIITLKEESASHRKILEEYSISSLDKMLTIVTPSILMAYCLYTFSSTQSRTMMYTIPFVLYGIFRYEYLIDKENIGGKPEDVFFNDKPFLLDILLWGISVITIIYLKL